MFLPVNLRIRIREAQKVTRIQIETLINVYNCSLAGRLGACLLS
jgi:hypothetical protein